MTPRARATEAVRAEILSAGRFVRRTWTVPGRERALVVQSLKAAFAALLAWVIARSWLEAPMPYIAPWVAVVLVRATVYRSYTQALQQLAAIALGTVLATAGGMALGDPTVAMAVVLPVTMLLSNWGKLGDQGLYGATAALFSLSFGEPGVGVAVVRLLESALGAAVGVGVNVLVLPPVYLRSTRNAIGEVVEETTRTLTAVADGLASSWEDRLARDWHRRARGLHGLLEQARSALEWSRESARFNPHRGHRAKLRNLEIPFQQSLYLLEQLTDHLNNLTRTLVEAADQRADGPRPAEGVAAVYSEFLTRAAAAVEAYGGLIEGSRPAHDRFSAAVDGVSGAHDELRHSLRGRDVTQPEWLSLYGSLLADARRVTEELLAEQSRHRDDQ
ncbi:FUSC family protein [Streptomyces fulvorobeus]|uniref:FUSC family protein n=1 Tax=Streptomyces fulvorobeus TaxID=284028 RepID=A0A7J0BYL7_9ACTN|nr:aromatic acid exporter family protein [Streptomyces fulvorobeus]NYE39139.1 uncharacterized membrane protein YgaE (UPF0421/DUF939 family) [Streptomyces fulvorobeus]GFM95340.1 FUSC family protein [Streptomyces fulvorobeus]